MTPPIKPGEREAHQAPPPSKTRESNGTPPEGKAAPGASRARKAFLLLGAVVGALLLATMVWFFLTRNQVGTDDAQIEADVVPIAAQTAGRVAEVLARDNQVVKKGDLLLRIDDVDHQARLKQAQAELATAQARAQAAEAQEQIAAATAKGGLSSARAGVTGSTQGVSSAESQVKAAGAALEKARSEARKAELDLARTRQLHEAGALPQENLDEDQLKASSAQAAVAQAQAALTSAQQQKNVSQARVGEAEGKLAASTPVEAQAAVAHAQTELAHAGVQSAEAAVTLAQNQLAYTRVVAPAEGVVSSLTARAGQLIATGQPVAQLVPGQIYVVANFKETQVGDIRPGDRVKISVDALPGTTLDGKVESLSGGTGARFSLLPPDNASGNFVKVVQRLPVRIALVNPPADLRLAAGLSANVTVYTR